MPNTWEENAPSIEPIDKKVSRFMQTIVGNKYDFIESDVAKQMSLYRYLLSHRKTPLTELYKSIKNSSGKPMFTLNELRNIHNYIEKHKFNKFAQRLLQTQSGGVEKEYKDPRKEKFFDKLITKGIVSIGRFFDNIIPECIGIPEKWKNTLFSVLFFLNTLEKNKLFGPMVSTGLDTIVLSLPVIISLVEEGAGKLIGLLPIPYASTAGDIIVYACSIIVVLFAVLLNISRKHFGEGFKVFLMVIPVFGDEIMTGAEQFEKGAESYMAKRERIVDAVAEISPTAAGIVDYWAPDVSTEIKPEPTYNLEAIKDDVVVYSKDAIQDTIGIDISTLKLDKIPSLGSLTANTNGDPEEPNKASGKEKEAEESNVGEEGENAGKEKEAEESNVGEEVENTGKEKEAEESNAGEEVENTGKGKEAEESNAGEEAEEAEKPKNKVKQLKRGKGSRNVTRGGRRRTGVRRSYKNQRRN